MPLLPQGAFIGKALLEGSVPSRRRRHGVITLGGFRMCDVFFKVLLGQSIGLADLRYIDPTEYTSLERIQGFPVEGILDSVTFSIEDSSQARVVRPWGPRVFG